MSKITVLGCPVDNLTMNETLEEILAAVRKKKQIHHTVVNVAKLVAMEKDEKLKNSVNNADLINADGAGVILLSKVQGTPIKERVPGIDLMDNVVRMAAKKNLKIFFFGAKEEIVKQTVSVYAAKYGEKIIAGYRNGYYTKKEEDAIAEKIASSNANVLFVAISSPIKENFLYKYRDKFESINFIMGVGGSFDVVAGKVRRAPLTLQKLGLEWLFRVYQEPARMWKRYTISNFLFLFELIRIFVKRLTKP